MIVIATVVTANTFATAPQHITSRNNPTAGVLDTLTGAYVLTKFLCRSTFGASAPVKMQVHHRSCRGVGARCSMPGRRG